MRNVERYLLECQTASLIFLTSTEPSLTRAQRTCKQGRSHASVLRLLLCVKCWRIIILLIPILIAKSPNLQYYFQPLHWPSWYIYTYVCFSCHQRQWNVPVTTFLVSEHNVLWLGLWERLTALHWPTSAWRSMQNWEEPTAPYTSKTFNLLSVFVTHQTVYVGMAQVKFHVISI